MSKMDAQFVSKTINLTGMKCPMPVAKLAQAVRGLEIGQAVEAFASDPGVMMDIPAWCRTTGNTLLLIEKQAESFHFIVLRSK
jgi:tRNA 2-thiouridine synthesizing protein A